MNFLIFASLLPGMIYLPVGSEKILFRETTHLKNKKRKRDLFTQTVAGERKWSNPDADMECIIRDDAYIISSDTVTALHKCPFVVRHSLIKKFSNVVISQIFNSSIVFVNLRD